MNRDTDDTHDSETTDQTASTDEGPITVRHDWTQSDHPSVTIVQAVAAATDRGTTELPPLQRYIDPDALEALLTRGSSPVEITFTYADSVISVNANGTIEIQAATSPTNESGE